MKTYELTYIISSGITSEEADAVIKDVESFVKEKEGIILTSHKTNPQTLSYLVKKQSSGYFVIATFQILEDKIKELKAKLEKESKVLRSFILVKKPLKIMKERRTRKPMFTEEKVPASAKSFGVAKEEKEVKIEDINKKLDEILSE